MLPILCRVFVFATYFLMANTSASADSRADLRAIFDEHHQATLQADPLGASIRGEPGFSDKLPDLRPEAIAARRVAASLRLKRLQALDRTGWSEDDILNADLLQTVLSSSGDGEKFHPEQYAIDDREGPQINIPQFPDRLPLRSRVELEGYVLRLENLGAMVDQTTDLLKAGLKAKRLPPKVAVARTAAQSRVLASPAIAKQPETSVLFRPLATLPDTDPLAQRARIAIATGITPAFARLATFLEADYIPACRDSVAASESIDGLAWYEYALRRHTTTSLTADQIHQMGLTEVARIRAEMLTVIARSGFKPMGNPGPDELFLQFVQFLRSDKRFYFERPQDLVSAYRDIAKRIDAELPRFFGVLPRNPYGVREIPRTIAESAPTAYYYEGSIKAGVPGYFMANTFALDQRPKYEMISLTLHEAMPGHHLQIALAQELANVHPFRTQLDFTVFIEGWGLYAERLGLEMNPAQFTLVEQGLAERTRNESHGLYADPYDDFGRLNYEMWRAMRLVVDTGLHAKGWSRQRAIDYMLANSALSPLNIDREVDRYISWPGQACAYKIGELKIRELRAKAEAQLGKSFDVRAFHDHLLGAGALPLDVLQARMERWIAQRANAGSPKGP